MQASNIKNDYIAVAMSLHGQFKKYIFLCGCVCNSHLFKGNEILWKMQSINVESSKTASYSKIQQKLFWPYGIYQEGTLKNYRF